MPMTASDILHNADAYRAAYPDFGRPAVVSSLDIDRIATRFVCGLLTANEAITLLEKTGCTYVTACDHLARWQNTVDDIDDEYRRERADYA